MSPRLTDGMVKEICTSYQAGMSSRQIATCLSVSPTTVLHYLHLNGVPVRRKCGGGHARYHCNEDYFNVLDTTEKAYWLGFLAADGCVFHRTRPSRPNISKRLQLLLQASDRSHIERFRTAINSDHPISIVATTARLNIYSNHLCAGLAQYGVVQRKTRTMRFPDNIPTTLLSHYMRGYFDGDGCWYVPNLKNATFSVVSSNENFLAAFQQHLMHHCHLGETKLTTLHGDVKRLKYGGRLQLQRIIKFLYQDALVYLPRKWAKAQQILYHYVDFPTKLALPVIAYRLACWQ